MRVLLMIRKCKIKSVDKAWPEKGEVRKTMIGQIGSAVGLNPFELVAWEGPTERSSLSLHVRHLHA